MPKGAVEHWTSFSSGWCGAWSLAMASTVPSTSPATRASTSADERSGGFILVAVEKVLRATSRSVSSRWCGDTSQVTSTPRHLLLTDREVAESTFSTATKMKPPLRSAADVEALVAGLVDGTVDAIASDHAPHHPDEKDVQFSTAPFGILGLETTVSLCLDRLVRPGVLELGRLVELLSTGPARVLDLPGGSLAPGAPADLTLIDLERQVTVRAGEFRSKSRNTPFEGWTLTGAAVGTLLDGEPVRLP